MNHLKIPKFEPVGGFTPIDSHIFIDADGETVETVMIEKSISIDQSLSADSLSIESLEKAGIEPKEVNGVYISPSLEQAQSLVSNIANRFKIVEPSKPETSVEETKTE